MSRILLLSVLAAGCHVLLPISPLLDVAGSPLMDGSGDGSGNSDADGDGVYDSADKCPGFDDTADADGDGIPDACDACGGTGIGDDRPDGCLDESFGTGGTFVHHISGDDGAVGVGLQSDGKVVAGGYAGGRMAAWRLTDTGTLDSSFSDDGYFVDAASGQITDAHLQKDNKLVVYGHVSMGAPDYWDYAVWRLTADGARDTTFNSDGFLTQQITTTRVRYDLAFAGTVRPDGTLMLTGYCSGESWDFALVAFDSTGNLDTSFNTNGYFVQHNTLGGNAHEAGFGITATKDNKTVVVGRGANGTNDAVPVWRFRADGSLDTTFAGVGYASADDAAGVGDDRGHGVAIQLDGKIVVSGYSSNGSSLDMAVWRFNDDGTPDTSFNSVGHFVHDNAAGGSPGNDVGSSVAIDKDGRIVVAGYSYGKTSYDMAIWRLNNDGTLDTDFNGVGYFTHDGAAAPNQDEYAEDVVIRPNGRIVAVGSAHNGTDKDMVVWQIK